MQHSDSFIQTTTAGSLPRTETLIDAYSRRVDGEEVPDFDRLLADGVGEVVAHQREVGLRIPGDGEYGKSMACAVDYGAWWSYIFDRVDGLEIDDRGDAFTADVRSTPGHIRLTGFAHRRDRTVFADAYADPESGIYTKPKKRNPFPKASGPIHYVGQGQVARDLANFRAALDASGYDDGFITALSPGSAARITNDHYASEEEFIWAWADVLHEEYKAILDAGLTLQIDDPSIAENFDQITPEPSVADYVAFTRTRIEALNHALEGLDQDRVRLHICWGSWHGPHTTDLEFRHLIDLVLEANVGGYSFEAANARHEHEWTVWRDHRLPDGKVILPGVVSHATNVVEHPELVAQRIERFAGLVGRENVIASTDCGLGGRVHPHIAWAKLQSLAEGARIATERLF